MTIIIYHYAMVRVEYRDTPPLVFIFCILNHQLSRFTAEISPGKESSALEERDLEQQSWLTICGDVS